MKKIISLCTKKTSINHTIEQLITAAPKLYTNQKTAFAKNKLTHVQYVLTALKCLETQNYDFLYDNLKNKNLTNTKYKASLTPFINCYKKLNYNQKRILTFACLFHDIYFNFSNNYDADHGIFGADYLSKNPQVLQQFNLNKEEQKAIIALTKYHGFSVDLGRQVLLSELDTPPEYQELLLILDFCDIAGKSDKKTNKPVCLATKELNQNLVKRYRQIKQLKKQPDKFYLFRLKNLFCPFPIPGYSQKEYQNFCNQLHQAKDAPDLIKFLNTKLKVDDFACFQRGFELLPLNSANQKDYSLYLNLFHRLKQTSQNWKCRFVRMDNNQFEELSDIQKTDIANLFNKIQNNCPDAQLFDIDPSKEKIYLNYSPK